MARSGISRRGLLRASAQLLTGGVASSTLGWLYVTLVEPEWLQIEEIQIPLGKMHPDLNGFKIAQFSDLHFGRYMRGREAQEIVTRVNRLNPDLIVFTGDFVSTLDHGEAALITQSFRQLQAPFGVYAILGNHDHWTDPDVVDGAVRYAGVTLLRNENRLIQRGEGRFRLAGVDDVWEKQHDLDQALKGVQPIEPLILLAHEPDYADEVALSGRVDVQLSGHSHGGQVRLPYFGAFVLPYLGQKYPFGLRRIKSTWLYTNRGVGVLAPPVRFNCRPEITLIELVSTVS